MTVTQEGNEYIIRISAKGISKAEIKSLIKYMEVRNITSGKRNAHKALALGKLANKDSLKKYGSK